MKYNDTIQILKAIANAINDPMSIADKLRKSDIFNFSNQLESNNNMDNSIYAENNSNNKDYNESVPRDESKSCNDNKSVTSAYSKSYNDNKSDGYYNDKQDTSSDPQGVMDSITQEMTSVRLQQAIILSEIVGKPRSKTRKKRRF